MQSKVISICKDILHAQANADLKAEQAAYERLREMCDQNGVNFNNALEGGIREAKKSIAIQMRGIK